jgi:hypothetical protein
MSLAARLKDPPNSLSTFGFCLGSEGWNSAGLFEKIMVYG